MVVFFEVVVAVICKLVAVFLQVVVAVFLQVVTVLFASCGGSVLQVVVDVLSQVVVAEPFKGAHLVMNFLSLQNEFPKIPTPTFF